MKTNLLRVALLLAALPAAAQSGPKFSYSGDVRLRWEDLSTPSGNAAADEDYDFTHARARLTLDLEGSTWKLHATGQGAAARSLPDNAAFGIGRSYWAASDRDTDPETAGLLELSFTYKVPGFRLTVGRQAYGDGFETTTGLDRLDLVKRTRLAERLVGNWEWTAVGRRFDGATFAVDGKGGNLSGFALRVLSGGVNLASPLEQLDTVDVYGATYTFKRGALMSHSELRLFDVGYHDDRAAIAGAARGSLSFQTFGASLLGGTAATDWLVWGALQRGSWGATDQDAWAVVAEAGHQFLTCPLKTWVRGGVAMSSGDGSPGTGDRATFFNLVPTNHKWYGAMDYAAFSNLTNYYVHALVFPAPRLQMELALHRLELTERSDWWVLGSGPYNDANLGYAVGGANNAGSHIGDEIDLIATYGISKAFAVEAGGGFFLGGEVAEASLPVHSDGTWLYAQLTWKF
jgi:hypothetical protein